MVCLLQGGTNLPQHIARAWLWDLSKAIRVRVVAIWFVVYVSQAVSTKVYRIWAGCEAAIELVWVQHLLQAQRFVSARKAGHDCI